VSRRIQAVDSRLAGGVWSPGFRLTTTALVITVTVVALESLSVATVLPVVSRHLGDLRLYGWVFSAFFLSSLIGTVVAGALADRDRLQLAAVGGLTLFAVGLIVSGAAANMPVLVGGRFIQGFGAGAVPAAAYVAISRTYSVGARPRMFAVLSTAWVLPGLIGPVLAAQVAAHFGWRWVFFGLVPAVVVAAIMTAPVLARVPPPQTEAAGEAPNRIPIGWALAVAAGAAGILAGLSLADPVESAPLVLMGAVLLVSGLRHLTPPGTLRARRGLPAVVLVRGLLTFSFFAGDAYVPLTLTSIRHTSTTFAGLTLTVATLTWTSGSWFQARIVTRVGPRPLVRSGLGLTLVGLAGLVSLLWSAVPLWIAPLAWAVAGFGIGIAYSPLSLSALGWARPGQEGRASSSVQLTDLLGTAFGTGTAGAIIASVVAQGGTRRLGLGVAFALAGAVATLGVMISPRLPATASRSAGGVHETDEAVSR
jgi:MFS family permease